MADHEHMSVGDLRRDLRLLRAFDQVIHQYAEPPSWARLEAVDDAGQVVDASQVLDDDTLDAQVVTPHLLDELGVVPAFDVDAARSGDLRPYVVDGHRPGRRTRLLR